MDISGTAPDEVIIASAGAHVYVYDSNGTQVRMYNTKQNGMVTPKCLSLLGEDYFIGAVDSKILVWPVSNLKANIEKSHKKLNVLATTRHANYCAAAENTEICIWNVQSGEMVASFIPHYQDITCLRFTSDDSMLISGGKDGKVIVWQFSKLISVNCNASQVKPLYTWNNHTKKVADIFVGSMGIYSRIATVSADMTCKLYELDTGLLLSTLCLDVPLTAVVMDPLEAFLLVGAQNGSILRMSFQYDVPKEVNKIDLKDKVMAHDSAISCLSISALGDKFVTSAVDDYRLKVWEVASLSCVFLTEVSNVFTNVFFTLKPSLLHTDLKPRFPIRSFARTYIQDKFRNKQYSNRPLVCIKRPISLVKTGGMDEFHGDYLLSLTPEMKDAEKAKDNPKEMDQKKLDNLYQEVYRGETLNEVRDINAQLYAYMVEHAFGSMGPREQISEMRINIEEH